MYVAQGDHSLVWVARQSILITEGVEVGRS